MSTGDPWEERRKRDFEFRLNAMINELEITYGDTWETCLNKVLVYLYKERERIDREIERLEPRDGDY